MDMRTLTVHDYHSYSVEAGAAAVVKITDDYHPTRVTAMKEFSWYVVGTVYNDTVHNPAVGYHYRDGPADKVVLVKKDGSEVELAKGGVAAYAKKGDYAPGSTIDSRDVFRGAKLPKEGTYTIWLVAGSVSDDELALAEPVEGGYMLETSHLAGLQGVPFAVGAEAPILVDTLWDWLVRPALALSPVLFTGGVVAWSEFTKRR